MNVYLVVFLIIVALR